MGTLLLILFLKQLFQLSERKVPALWKSHGFMTKFMLIRLVANNGSLICSIFRGTEVKLNHVRKVRLNNLHRPEALLKYIGHHQTLQWNNFKDAAVVVYRLSLRTLHACVVFATHLEFNPTLRNYPRLRTKSFGQKLLVCRAFPELFRAETC